MVSVLLPVFEYSIVEIDLRAGKDRALRSVSHRDSSLTAGPLAFLATAAIDTVDALQRRQSRGQEYYVVLRK